MHTRAYLVAAGFLLGGAGTALAGPIITPAGTFDDSGTGFGNILNVLSLQGSPNEWGSVLRSGGADALTGDATNQSSTRTVGEMISAGVGLSNFAIVFNINEPGSADMVTLQHFTLRFYDSADAVLFDATWTGSLDLAPVSQGTGGAGYVFEVAFSPAQAAFFSDPGNRVGMFVSEGSTTEILNSFNGPDNFYIVPGPSALALMSLGVGFAGYRRR